MSEDDSERLLNVNQVAELMGISTRSVWRMAQHGRIPKPVRFSRKMVRWQQSLILAHIRSKTHDQ